eukprot:4975022-Pleurochrysis_carterae.AAC.1
MASTRPCTRSRLRSLFAFRAQPRPLPCNSCTLAAPRSLSLRVLVARDSRASAHISPSSSRRLSSLSLRLGLCSAELCLDPQLDASLVPARQLRSPLIPFSLPRVLALQAPACSRASSDVAAQVNCLALHRCRLIICSDDGHQARALPKAAPASTLNS